MHQLDLHVDILYILNTFLVHRHDTGTTEKCIDAIRSDTDPKPRILWRGRESSVSLPRQRIQGLGYNPLVLVHVTNRYQMSAGLRLPPSPRGDPLVPVPGLTGTKG